MAGGLENTLWRSVNGGLSWAKLNSFGKIEALAIYPDRPGRIFAAANGMFGVSVDAGRHWRKIGRGLPGSGSLIRTIRIDPADRQHLYFATSPGVWESRDGGETFQPIGANLGDSIVERLELAGGKLYAGIAGRGVFRWNPTLATWETVGRRLPKSFNGMFVPDPEIPGRLWAGTYGGGLLSLAPE